jgi:preprotein translocase subunit SecG
MGAYIAGSSRTLRASLYVIVLAAAFLVYVMGTYLHVKFTKSVDPPQPQINDAAAGRTSLKKRRKRLLLFAILMAAITYQAGLRPPGGFWPVEQGQGHSSPGSPILEGMYPRRYRAFFYCNAMSFMASIALIILLQDDKTYQAAGIRFYGLYACMLVGMLVLMGAYAAGTARRLRTSIYVFALVGGVSVFIAVLLALFVLIRRQEHQGASSSTPTPTTLAPGGRQSSNANGNGGSTAGNNNDDDNHQDRQSSNAAYAGGTAENDDDDNHRRQGEGGHAKRKYVMLLAMLAASVTYQAGLDPPGGVWPEGYAAGSPVLHDSNLRRYHVFFYSNSSSFVASIVVIILLLQSELRNMPSRHGRQQHNVQRIDEPRDNPLLLMATNTVVALDLVGLLVAYAAGSSRTMDTSLYVIVLVVAVVIYIVVHVRLPDAVNPGPGEGTSNTQGASGERRNGANGQHEQADALSP